MDSKVYEEMGSVSLELLQRRAELARKHYLQVKAAYEKSPVRLGHLVERVQRQPGTTLELVADILLENGLEEF